MSRGLECSEANGFAGDDADLPCPLVIELTVEDRDTIAELCALPEGPSREQLALDALRIGVLALRQARGQIDGEQVRRAGEQILLELQGRLAEHAGLVHSRLTGALKEYFDPESGRFPERVNRLVGRDGELEALLRRQVGDEDSQLCRTLAAHFGSDSPLVKLLSPTESQGLLQALRETLEEQLCRQRERILDEFSLDNKQGALARLVGELAASHEKFAGNLQNRIDDVVREFSLDEENSALSRLVRNVEGAQRTIASEFSLDNEESAFCRLKRLLESTREAIDGNLTLDSDDSALARLRKEVLGLLEKHAQTNADFQEQVKVSLATMLARREEAARSTRHGRDFEGAVCEFLALESQRAGDVAMPTGDTTGLISHCKKGDCVIALGPESCAPGARIVVEAKEEAGYQLHKALEELEQARKNRGAQIGLFVYSRKTAPETLEPLKRYGSDVVVVWDQDDTNSDVVIKAALALVRALCIRSAVSSAAQQADFQAVEESILAIEKAAAGLDVIEKSAKTISNGSRKILKQVQSCRKILSQQVRALRETTRDLQHLLGEPPAA